MPKEAIYTTILVVPSAEPILEDAIAEDFTLIPLLWKSL
jgi:hypothetical protein